MQTWALRWRCHSRAARLSLSLDGWGMRSEQLAPDGTQTPHMMCITADPDRLQSYAGPCREAGHPPCNSMHDDDWTSC